MHYLALAADYDGTIADDGVVDEPTLTALERPRGGVRRLILVTGRDLTDLQRVMPRLVTTGARGARVAGLVDQLLVTDLTEFARVALPEAP